MGTHSAVRRTVTTGKTGRRSVLYATCAMNVSCATGRLADVFDRLSTRLELRRCSALPACC